MMITMQVGLKSLHEIARAPSWTQEQFLQFCELGWLWMGLGDTRIKPRVRVPMGRNVVTLRKQRTQCSHKKRYATVTAAFNAMVANHGKSPDYNIYECPHCRKWHVGHRERIAA